MSKQCFNAKLLTIIIIATILRIRVRVKLGSVIVSSTYIYTAIVGSKIGEGPIHKRNRSGSSIV